MNAIFKLLGISGLQFYLTAALVIGAAAGGAWGAWEIQAGRAARHELAAVSAALKESQRQSKAAIENVRIADKITYDYGVQAASAQRKVQVRTETLIREVTQYVPQTVDVATPIPNGFVRFFDAAWAGAADPATVPIAPGQSDATASDVLLSEIATVSAANAGACYENAGNLTALQGWIHDIQAWEAKVRASLAGP